MDDHEKIPRLLPLHTGGLFCAASDLLIQIDDPAMTIATLRESSAARMLRKLHRNMRAYLHESLMDARMSPEERETLRKAFELMPDPDTHQHTKITEEGSSHEVRVHQASTL
jgi:hypothetical protein